MTLHYTQLTGNHKQQAVCAGRVCKLQQFLQQYKRQRPEGYLTC